MVETKKKPSTETMILGALLTALVIILQLMGSFIRFGPFSISLVLIPIVIGAATCGTKISTWLGLVFGIINFSAGREVIKGIESIEEGTRICLNASVVLSGALPLVYMLSRLLVRPLKAIGGKIGINEYAVVGLFSTLATSSTLFPIMDKMDKKGVVLTSAFSVSGAFTFGAHLAFTMAFDKSYIVPVIIGKLVAGVFAVLLAAIIYKIKNGEGTEKEEGVI